MKVDINNLSGVETDVELLKKVAKKTLSKEKKKDYSLSIALVDGKTMREINKKYRGQNRETDVLSFAETNDFPERENYLGEIVICPSQVEKEEMVKVLIHGILHLLGYNHEKDEKSAKRMREKETFLLNDFHSIITK